MNTLVPGFQSLLRFFALFCVSPTEESGVGFIRKNMFNSDIGDG